MIDIAGLLAILLCVSSSVGRMLYVIYVKTGPVQKPTPQTHVKRSQARNFMVGAM